MTIGLVGRKSGMTRVFTEDGASIPVTVVEVSPNRVTQIKELDSDGYRAIQVTAGNRKASKVSKSEAGHFAKAGVEAGNGLWEFRLEDADEAPEVGAELTVERSKLARKLMWPASPRVRASRALSSAGTSACRMPLTATPSLTVPRAPLASARLRAVCSRARRWRVTWVPKTSPPRVWKLSVLMPSAICCSSRVPYPVHLAVTLSYVPRSRLKVRGSLTWN